MIVRRKVLRGKPFQICCSDLIDMSALQSMNNGYNWICVFQDSMSNYIFLNPMRQKSKKNMIESLDKFLATIPSNFTCEKLWTDEGK